MPRRTQRERTIQRRAIKWLAQWYIIRSNGATILGVEEAAIVRGDRFWGRVDGLLAIQHANGEVHTVAVEAKSWRTRHHVQTKYGCLLMFLTTVIGSVVATSLAIWLLRGLSSSAWVWLAGIGGGLVAAILIIIWVVSSARFRRHDVIEQVARYPAAQRWIAIARDMKVDVDALKTACGERSIGVLIVPRRGDPWIEIEPRPAGMDLLGHYKREVELRERMRISKPGIHIEVERGVWEYLT